MHRRDFLKAAAWAAPVLTAGTCPAEDDAVSGSPSIESSPEDVVDIGSAKQLFVDDYLVESSKDVRLVMNPPRKMGRVLVRDQPWEVHQGSAPHLPVIGGYNTIMRDGGRIRLWYMLNHQYSPLVWANRETLSSVFYAESEDGIHFEKPNQGLHNFYGSKENNLVIPGPVQGGHVWLDPHAQPEDRYRIQGNGPGGLDFYSSPDGIAWKKTHSVRMGKVDGRSHIFWDDPLGRYVLYTRHFVYPPNAPPKGAGGYRGTRQVRRLESDDLIRWDNQKIVLRPGEIDRIARPSAVPEQPPVDYNFASFFRYPEEEGLMLAMVTTYWHWFDRSWMGIPHSTAYNLGPNANDIRLVVSRDGFHWHRPDRRPFIGSTGNFGDWNMANVQSAGGSGCDGSKDTVGRRTPEQEP